MNSILEGDNELTNQVVVAITLRRDNGICLQPVAATQRVVVEIYREIYLRIISTRQTTKNHTGPYHKSNSSTYKREPAKV